jgi:hypothetical protein
MINTIKIFGDKYRIKKTYDIDDFGIGRYGFDVYNESDDFLSHFVGDKINKIRQYIKINFYKTYEGTYSYYK